MIQLIFEVVRNSITLPVNPDHIEIKIPGNNEKANIVSLGEIVILRKPGLASFDISSFFPSDQNSEAYIDFFTAWRELKRPATFTANGLNITMQVAIEDFSYDRRAGEENDYYYDLSFTEYRDHAARIVSITDKGTTTPKSPARANNKPPIGQEYIIKRGDTLWGITKSKTGNGARWPELYNANKKEIGNNPNLIYPGRKLIIPAAWISS